MGQYFSSSIANSENSSTPQRIPNCVDPRSPTRDIDRTPIQFTSTASDENSLTEKEEEKPQRRRSLRQKMFANKKKMIDEKND